tara:strand:+ start:742 stop:1089 length:348 start_codon:yes stop_codon:yes gene_type:complete
MAQVIPCKCKYWEHEELPFDDFQGQALIIDGSLCCVECGAALEIKKLETDHKFNPSDIEDMVGELEYFVNPVHGIFADSSHGHTNDKELNQNLTDFVAKADEAGSMLMKCLEIIK